MKTEDFTVEGIKYTITRLSYKQKAEIMRLSATDQDKANALAISYALVEPKMTVDQVMDYDSAHTDALAIKIALFNKVPDFLDEKSLTTLQVATTESLATPTETT